MQLKYSSIVVVLTASIVSGIAIAKEPAAAPGEWIIRTSESALDKRSVTTVLLASDKPIINSVGQPKPAVLIFRCEQGKLMASLKWAGYVGSGVIPVQWRIDSDKVRTDQWQPLPGNYDTAILVYGPSVRRFFKSVAEGKQLLLRLSGYTNAQETTFDISKSAAAVGAIRDGCTT